MRISEAVAARVVGAPKIYLNWLWHTQQLSNFPVASLAQELHNGGNCAKPNQVQAGEANGDTEQVASQFSFEVGKVRLRG